MHVDGGLYPVAYVLMTGAELGKHVEALNFITRTDLERSRCQQASYKARFRRKYLSMIWNTNHYPIFLFNLAG